MKYLNYVPLLVKIVGKLILRTDMVSNTTAAESYANLLFCALGILHSSVINVANNL